MLTRDFSLFRRKLVSYRTIGYERLTDENTTIAASTLWPKLATVFNGHRNYGSGVRAAGEDGNSVRETGRQNLPVFELALTGAKTKLKI
jgi:hypothetical protein